MVGFFGLNFCVLQRLPLYCSFVRLNLEDLSLSDSFTKFLMYSKNTFFAERDQSSPAKRLRKNISDLYLAGGVSAQRAASLFEDSVAAGARNTEDLAVPVSKNSQRDLKRKLLKNSKWPPLYEIEMPVLHQKLMQRLWKRWLCYFHMKFCLKFTNGIRALHPCSRSVGCQSCSRDLF